MIRLGGLLVLMAPVWVACTEDPIDGSASCEYVATGDSPVDLPPSVPAYQGKVSAVLRTTAGDLNLLLDASKRPCSVNAFLSLAAQDFYDDVPCPWLGTTAPQRYLQCGESGDSARPGYTFPDEGGGSDSSPAGTVVLGEDGELLLVYAETAWSQERTTLGTFDVSSIRILQNLAARGTDEASQPVRPVDVTDVVIR